MYYGDVHIIHEMADGTILEDISGKVVPVNQDTEGVYRTLYKIAERLAKERNNTKEAGA